jgi:hypothetical protein
VLFGSAFHAGCIVPIAQVLCVLLCLQAMSALPDDDSLMTAQQRPALTDGSEQDECHSPTSTDLTLISHMSSDWLTSVEHLQVEMLRARFELQSIRPQFESPDSTVNSPPPKFFLFS